MANTQGSLNPETPLSKPFPPEPLVEGDVLAVTAKKLTRTDVAPKRSTKAANEVTKVSTPATVSDDTDIDDVDVEDLDVADDVLQQKLAKIAERADAIKQFAEKLEAKSQFFSASKFLKGARISDIAALAKGSTQTTATAEAVLDEASVAREQMDAQTAQEKTTEEDIAEAQPQAATHSILAGNGKGIFESVMTFYLQVAKHPLTFAKHYEQFALEMLRIVRNKSELHAERGDSRFRDAVWQDNPLYRTVLKTYLAWHKQCKELVNDLEFEDDDRKRTQFLLEQLAAAVAPSNTPFNPSAVKRAFQTGGQSFVDGLKNLLNDIEHNKGMPRQITPDSFTVGGDLSVTPGVVVHRTEKLELIQYKPTHAKVFSRPVIIVPPQINKFYVFDLSPRNSIVNYLLDQGLQVFIISWKNPSKANANWGMDDYITDIENTIDVTMDITHSPDVSLVSACAGGVTTMSMLAYLGKKHRDVVKNHSMLVTALQIGHHPILSLFLTKDGVKQSLAHVQRSGVMDGRELANIFAWLRPTDLVWNYWVNNYLLGKEPPSLDVLYWDNDPTRLPAALHRDFMDIFVNDRFATDVPMTIKGELVTLKDIKADTYFLAGQEDYLMPWKNCYKNIGLLDTTCEFVLSDAGHIQSVLRPPGIGRTTYYTDGDTNAATADEWKETASLQQGSWWEHWKGWLTQRSGEEKAAPSRLGSDKYPPLCAAPGEYVMEK